MQNIFTVCNYSERCFLQNDSEALYLKCSYFFSLTWSLVTSVFPEENLHMVIPALPPVGMDWKLWWLSPREPDESGLLVKVGPACAKSLYSTTFQLPENFRLLKQLLKCKMWKASHKSSCPYWKYFWELEHFSDFFKAKTEVVSSIVMFCLFNAIHLVACGWPGNFCMCALAFSGVLGSLFYKDKMQLLRHFRWAVLNKTGYKNVKPLSF